MATVSSSTTTTSAAAFSASASSSNESSSAGVSAEETRATLHSLYRRLLECGEEGTMMQRTISVSGLSQAIPYGMQLLRLHKGLTGVDCQAHSTSPLFHPLRRARLACQRRYYAWSIFALRLKLRSWNAISNALVYTLFLVVCVLLYEIYRACRIGVDRAEDRYRTLAIPILQTFEAMEAAQERRRKLLKELESDIARER